MYIKDAQEWSYGFGRLMYSALSNGPTPDNQQKLPDIQGYKAWLISNVNGLNWRGQEGGHKIQTHCINETNFHALNMHLIPMWRALASGGWESDKQRYNMITKMHKHLAVAGLIDYTARQRYVEKIGSEALFMEHSSWFAQATNGALQEFDGGSVLLDAIKENPALLMVASPLQFERGPNSSRNSDFMVIDMLRSRVVGAQIKSNVHDGTIEKYDPDRIVLIDGNVDFDNVLSTRTKKGSSSERVVSWPGMLCAKHTLSLPAPGRGMSPPERMENLRIRAMAAQALGSVRVDRQRAVSRIRERIMDAL